MSKRVLGLLCIVMLLLYIKFPYLILVSLGIVILFYILLSFNNPIANFTTGQPCPAKHKSLTTRKSRKCYIKKS